MLHETDNLHVVCGGQDTKRSWRIVRKSKQKNVQKTKLYNYEVEHENLSNWR